MGGVSQYTGVVEVCIDGVWGVVCPVGWDVREAAVVCRQLGFTSTGKSRTYTVTAVNLEKIRKFSVITEYNINILC